MRHRGDVETIDQQIQVSFTYPVHFMHDVFGNASSTLVDALRACGEPAPYRVLVYVDQGVMDAHPQLVQRIQAYAEQHGEIELVRAPIAVPGGEQAKNGWNIVRNIMGDIGNAHLDRHSFVAAVGGGSVIDSVGFAASVVHRGIRLVRVPTTVLAQCDAAIGVKNGMDEHGMKNFVGTFAPPYAVLVDFDFLSTLSDKYWHGGVAEAFKVAIIKDAAFFDYLERHAGELAERGGDVIEDVVKRTARLHLDHIRSGGDPFELGTARPLDFGHWAGHKLEVLSNYRLGHGQAVSIGIALDACYAADAGYISHKEFDRIYRALAGAGLPAWDDLLESRDEDGIAKILRGLEEFREHLGGNLTVTLPHGIGHRIEVHHMDRDRILASVRELKARARRTVRAGTSA